ncbi:cation-translocating P-type ATPase [Candidatus Woesearchaeota archaeon]|nr:cation-translocating P-type ATPase [Candidatus Woesearchaeota archaeon]
MHHEEVDRVRSVLGTPLKGLTKIDAEERLSRFGFNEIKKDKELPALRIFLSQLSSPLLWILLAAIGISLFLNEKMDALIISLIVILNYTLGFFQEYRAEKSLLALRKTAPHLARVIRDNVEQKIESRYLVPGDIIILEAGDVVPADARLMEVHSLQTVESALTGESLPIDKHANVLHKDTPLAERKNMVYSSTAVSRGRGQAIVINTSMRTEIGKIARQVKEADMKSTPLQAKIKDLGFKITILVLIIALIIFFSGLLSGQPWSEIALIAMAISVAAIPEGLPAVITISLALGAHRMAKRKALIRKLPSAETLGSVGIICTDKTGTLTLNQMTVSKIWANKQVYELTGTGFNPLGSILKDGQALDNPELKNIEPLFKAGILCNDTHFALHENTRMLLGDPTEGALLVSAEKAGLQPEILREAQPRVEEIPFSSERKLMTTIHQLSVNEGRDTRKEFIHYTKGSPHSILDKCDKILINGQIQRLDFHLKREIIQQNEVMANKALRVLAFAFRYSPAGDNSRYEAETNLIFLGLQGMKDLPREETKASLQKCAEAGIKVIMITGDQLATAKSLAASLGITGRAISSENLPEIDLDKEVENISIFARVTPTQKLEIISALKKKGHIVAMIGDGLNDAPAMKKADISVSMGFSGTEISKEAADMVLTDDNFASIVNAVEEGRNLFGRIRNFTNYLLSCNLGEIVVLFLASLYGFIWSGSFILPLTAVQILWTNLITDGLPATALSFDRGSPQLMKEKPLPPQENILPHKLMKDIIIFGSLMGLVSFVLFLLYQKSGEIKVQSIVFTSLIVFEFIRLQTIRSGQKLRLRDNKPLMGALVLSLVLQLIILYTPLSALFHVQALDYIDWGVIVLAGAVLLGVYKLMVYLQNKSSTDNHKNNSDNSNNDNNKTSDNDSNNKTNLSEDGHYQK